MEKSRETRSDFARMNKRDFKKSRAVFLKAFGGMLEKAGDPLAQVVSVSCQETVRLIV